ncbi:MAG: phosphopyruvate hydratase [Candidatus Paceibacterota bacterium]
MEIKNIQGYEVLDSRGNPTTACIIELLDGTKAKAYVPSGASTGAHEAVELRDGNLNRYNGLGVLMAINNINSIINQALIGKDAYLQSNIDQILIDLDGTYNKSKLGANATLAVSLAVARAGAISQKKELYQYIQDVFNLNSNSVQKFPQIGFNVLNGGKHADSGLDVQEYMIMPLKDNIDDNIRIGAEIYHTLKNILAKNKQIVSVGDEGGFAPRLENNEAALNLLIQAIQESGYVPGIDCALALDIAATEFFDNAKSIYTFDKKTCSGAELSEIYQNWLQKYPIVSIEDPFAEDDYASWKGFYKLVNKGIRIVGDDLLVTNTDRIQKAIEQKLCNSVLIKPNQIGTLTETINAINLAHNNNLSTMISHRSGDTIDTFIADLAVGVSAGFMKSGAPARAERVSKYNRLLEIYYI